MFSARFGPIYIRSGNDLCIPSANTNLQPLDVNALVNEMVNVCFYACLFLHNLKITRHFYVSYTVTIDITLRWTTMTLKSWPAASY